MKIVFLLALIPLLALIGVAYFIWIRVRRKTVKSFQAMLITGNGVGKDGDPGVVTDKGRLVKVVLGGGHTLKMFQNHQVIDLTSFQLELHIPRVTANGGVPIKATATAQITVSREPSKIVTYAEQFSSKVGKNGDTSQIERELKEILEGNLRTVLSAMSVEDILVNRQKFNEDVVTVASDQLQLMGFELTSLVLKDIDDADEENPYIENLGRSLVATVRKNAEIAEADNNRESRIHVAEQNKQAEEEELKRAAELDEVRRETALKQQENKRQVDLAKVKAERDKELEDIELAKKVQEESLKLDARRKEEELRIKQLEKDRQVDIELREADVRKAKADADFYETTKRAEADARKAEIDGEAKARIEEIQGLAEVKIKEQAGLADATVREQAGLAEAKVILERGKAEAESKRLLAEAIAQHGEVVIVEKLIEMLPLYAREIAAPLQNIDSVKIYDMGGENGGSGVANYAQGITRTATQLLEPLEGLTGIDVPTMLSNLSKRGVFSNALDGSANKAEVSKAIQDVLGAPTPEAEVEVKQTTSEALQSVLIATPEVTSEEAEAKTEK